MAFNFTKLEPVGFGDFKAMPKLTQELRLRLERLKFKTEADAEKAINVLAECFGDKSTKVKTFMRDNFVPMDYMRLQVYLLQGDKGLEDLERRMDALFMDRVKEDLEKRDDGDKDEDHD